ncbi:hypothetical protein I302_100623 [Kwoniella bestiolae CBS 10118]|uniref:N-acetyltransferase domain-containing protein n=1 Tax=Kwoniella bestiolae CBS 10118 TaxID=1296100 RepID=A0A1B9G5K4_9TREE|nr:hypothetical protein I302_03997 [Kwoniella bestiolae CBS 10118]OCF26314.1 hypothetical protein I302_03997 [Kwoniella bestiolae CBS 10118]
MSSSSFSSTGKVRPPFTLKVALTKDEIQACYDIRIEVFSVEQGFPLETEIDEHDPTSIHFLLTTPIPSPPSEQTLIPNPPSKSHPSELEKGQTTEKPIGTIRYVPSLSKLTRLAVDQEYRQYGFGKVLVDGMHKWIAANRGELNQSKIVEKGEKRVIKVKCHSQIPVIPFYAMMGYVSEGPEFDEEGGESWCLAYLIHTSKKAD